MKIALAIWPVTDPRPVKGIASYLRVILLPFNWSRIVVTSGGLISRQENILW